jgi:hypothetical protein
MAQWIIQRPQEHSHQAEVRVAEQLRELDDKWTVIWGFYYADKRGMDREGDFLVIGPAGGMLVLEVKNTLPRWFGATGRWEGEHDNPINQLMDEWSAVVGIVKDEGLPTWVAKALCIPGEEAPVEQDMVQGIKRSMLVLKNDLANWLPQVWLRIFDNRVRFPVPPSDREKILKRFGASADPAKARGFLDHTEELFQRQLTHRFQLLDQLRDNRQPPVQIVERGEIIVAFEEALFVDADMLDLGDVAPGQSPLHRTLHDGVGRVPGQAEEEAPGIKASGHA